MTTRTNIEEVYIRAVKPLSPADRFKLAILILNDISPHSVVDYQDVWTDEDVRDLAAHSLRHAAGSFGEKDETVDGG